MSDTNRVGVRIARSSARDVPITLAPNELTQVRYTGAPGLGFQPQNIISNEIRADRQVADLILVGAEAGGNLNFELSALGFDTLIESALFATFISTGRGAGADITGFGAGSFTMTDGDTVFEVGHTVRIVHTDVNGTIIDGVYEITAQPGASVQTAGPLAGSAGINPALTAGLTPNTGTQVLIVGARAQATGAISVSVAAGVATFTLPAALLANLMGEIGPGQAGNRPPVIGQWMKYSGFSTAANNIWLRITGVDTGANTLTAVAQTGMATDAAATEQVEIYIGDYLRNGVEAVTNHQFAVERRYEDHTPVTRELFLGMALNQLQINLQPQQIATGQLEFFGFNSAVSTVVGDLYSGGTPTDIEAPQTSVYNTSTNVGRVAIGTDNLIAAGATAENLPLEVQITLNNNLRRRPAIGVFGAASIGTGQLNIGGNINTYFDSQTILDIILGNLNTEYNTVLTAADGRTMVFDLPNIKFDGGAPDVPAGNQDVVLNPGIQGILSPTFGYSAHVQRSNFAR